MSQESMSQAPSLEDQIKALDEQIKAAEAGYDGVLAGELEVKKKELESQLGSPSTSTPETQSVAEILNEGDPVKIEKLDNRFAVTPQAQEAVDKNNIVTEEPVTKSDTNEVMGPDKELYFEAARNTELRQERFEMIEKQVDKIRQYVNSSEKDPFNVPGFPFNIERAVNSLAADFERMWQPRVRRELAGLSIENVYETSEAQKIYDEEIAKLFSQNADPGIFPLVEAFKNFKTSDDRVDTDAIAKGLESKKCENMYQDSRNV